MKFMSQIDSDARTLDKGLTWAKFICWAHGYPLQTPTKSHQSPLTHHFFKTLDHFWASLSWTCGYIILPLKEPENIIDALHLASQSHLVENHNSTGGGLGCCHLLNNHLAKPSSIKGVQVLGHIGDKARRKAGLLSSNRSHCLCNQTTFVISLHVMISTRKDHEGLCQWLATDMTVGQLDSEFLPYFWSCHIQETLLPPSQCS